MAKYKKITAALILAAMTSSTAFAQDSHAGHRHFSVAGTTVSGYGVGNISGVECSAVLSVTVGPNIGAPHEGHAEYADVYIENFGTGCDNKTVSARVFANGTFNVTGSTGLPVPCTVPGSGTVALSNFSAVEVLAAVSPISLGPCVLSGTFLVGPTVQVHH